MKTILNTYRFVCIVLVVLTLLSACGPQPTGLPTILPTVQLTNTPIVKSPTPPPLPTIGTETATTAPTSTQSAATAELPDISESVYLDDRSTPAALMLSYFNAVNRKEYLRAYSYYTNFTEVGTLDTFTSGYADTQAVSVVIGNIFTGGAAGSIYFTVPMVLTATTTAGAEQKFAACYVLRLPQAQNFAVPPIIPMHIDRGTAQSIPLTTLDADALALACQSPDFPSGANTGPALVEAMDDISANNYIDNRSDAVAIFKSYLNAINAKEYVRAYSYWENPPESYNTFAAGFNTTASVTAQLGVVIPDAGAGQLYYSLPASIKSTLADGSQKTYVGCYRMHLSQPAVQGTVPFQPLGIMEATVNLVDNSAAIDSLLTTVCQ